MLRNLTPHTINIYNEKDELILSLDPEPGPYPRVEYDIQRPDIDFDNIMHDNVVIPVAYIGQLPLRVKDLPELESGVTLIVSRLVAEAALRPDLVFPFDEVRDTNGRVIGCKRFAEIHGHGQQTAPIRDYDGNIIAVFNPQKYACIRWRGQELRDVGDIGPVLYLPDRGYFLISECEAKAWRDKFYDEYNEMWND